MKFGTLIISIFILVVNIVYSQYEVITSYYDNGNIKAELSYINSIRDGISKYYYENGTPYQILFYDRGVLSGEFRQFHPNGKLHIQAYYKDGTLDGIKMVYDSLGNLLEYTNYSNGKAIDKIVLVDTSLNYYKKYFTSSNQNTPQRRYLKYLEKSNLGMKYLSYRNFNLESKIPKFLSNYKVIDNLLLSDKHIKIKDKDFLTILYRYIPYPTSLSEFSLEGLSWIKIVLTPEGKLLRSEIAYYLGYGYDYSALDVITNIKDCWDDIFELNDITTIILPINFEKNL